MSGARHHYGSSATSQPATPAGDRHPRNRHAEYDTVARRLLALSAQTAKAKASMVQQQQQLLLFGLLRLLVAARAWSRAMLLRVYALIDCCCFVFCFLFCHTFCYLYSSNVKRLCAGDDSGAASASPMFTVALFDARTMRLKDKYPIVASDWHVLSFDTVFPSSLTLCFCCCCFCLWYCVYVCSAVSLCRFVPQAPLHRGAL